MYTNIDLNEIAEALDFILEYDLQSPNKVINKPSLRAFLHMCVEFVTQNNFFTETTYGCYHQTSGIAMGSQLSKEPEN